MLPLAMAFLLCIQAGHPAPARGPLLLSPALSATHPLARLLAGSPPAILTSQKKVLLALVALSAGTREMAALNAALGFAAAAAWSGWLAHFLGQSLAGLLAAASSLARLLLQRAERAAGRKQWL